MESATEQILPGSPAVIRASLRAAARWSPSDRKAQALILYQLIINRGECLRCVLGAESGDVAKAAEVDRQHGVAQVAVATRCADQLPSPPRTTIRSSA